MRVEACAEGVGAVRWEPLASRDDAPPPLELVSRGECIAYVVTPAGLPGRFPVHATPDAFVGGDASVLLRPVGTPARTAIEVRFDVPDGVRVSTPWPTSDGVARPGASFLRRESHLAFGAGLDIVRFEAAGAAIERVRLPGQLAVADEALDAWLGDTVRAVATLTGRAPRERIQLVVLPVPASDAAVPFGLVRRGGGASVLLLVSVDATPDTLRRDWVAVHELAHLVFPLVHRDDAWLSEGLSTYYQEVLRARAGIIAPREAWRRMVAGFARGRGGAGSLPIGEESERMMATRSFYRVYWSGAAFALLSDLDLRARGSSLDALVRARRDALVAEEGHCTARDLLSLLEGTEHASLLTSRAEAFEASSDFPDVAGALDVLGIDVDAAGGVAFDEAEAKRALRAAIMGGD